MDLVVGMEVSEDAVATMMTEQAVIEVVEEAGTVIALEASQAATASRSDNDETTEIEATAAVHQETITTGRQSDHMREAMMTIPANEGTRSSGPRYRTFWVGFQPLSVSSAQRFPFFSIERVRLRPFAILLSSATSSSGVSQPAMQLLNYCTALAA